LTHLRIGGPAEWLVSPRSHQELANVLTALAAGGIPVRVLGEGTNLLVRDEGVRGAVLRLSAPCFSEIKVEGRMVKAGSGATLSAVISEASLHGLAGFETLVGISATVGGALRCNAGDRAGEIADYVKRIEVADERGKRSMRERSDMQFGDHTCDIEEPVVLSVEFELIPDSPDAIVKRLRRAWINRKAARPFSFQAAVRMFKDPRGYQASALIEKAGLAKTRIGAAEISERNGNYLVAHPGATSRDVLQLIDQVKRRVQDVCGVDLERELTVW
jgi:UDP-N-acetylmuramate dehydrogenase